MGMKTSPYFADHLGVGVEQDLYNDLIIETIQVAGQTMLYVPRREYNRDEILTEDSTEYFDTTYEIEMYLQNVEGFQGMGSLVQNFVPMLKDQVTLQFSMDRFEEEVLANEAWTERRPREGDLVWFPLQEKLFQITFVDKYQMLYPAGRLYLWTITCELFTYASEKFTTGVSQIDDKYGVAGGISQDIYDYALKTPSGEVLTDHSGDPITMDYYQHGDVDPTDQSDEIEEEADTFMDFSESDPFSEGDY